MTNQKFIYKNNRREETNIFRKILQEMPRGKIEIVPDNPEDKELARIMTILINLGLPEEEK